MIVGCVHIPSRACQLSAKVSLPSSDRRNQNRPWTKSALVLSFDSKREAFTSAALSLTSQSGILTTRSVGDIVTLLPRTEADARPQLAEENA